MWKKFSSTYGYKDPRNSFQTDSIDDELKNRIWNQVRMFFIDPVSLNNEIQRIINSDFDYRFFENIYDGFFKVGSKPKRKIDDLHKDLKLRYSGLEWYEVYDFIEFVAKVYYDHETANDFRTKMNEVLKDEMSGYRIIGNLIAPIIDDIEIKAIEDAMSSDLQGARIHLSNSLEALSDRENPDFINSIKESISAVESALNILSNKPNTPLNKSLQNLPFDIDKNLKQAFIKLYSWTSSADGIRHGMTHDKILSSIAEAKFMLITCSSFINYLLEKRT